MTLTLSTNATADGTVAIAAAYTSDGVHPSAAADAVIAATVNVAPLLAA